MLASSLQAGLRSARETLLGLSDEDVVDLLAPWARRWSDPAREVGEGGLKRLSGSTGWPRLHVVEAVRRAFKPWTAAAIRRAVVRASASGARSGDAGQWLLAVLAGRIPALAAGVVLRSLAARVPVVLKPSSAEPVFGDLLCESARRCSDLLGASVRVASDPDVVAAWVREAPACVAYGRDDTVDAIQRARAGRPTWCGGHRESLVVVFCEALDTPAHAASVARAIARDCAIYDQSGCLSPHVVFCEEGGSITPQTFAEMVYASLSALEARWPPATPTLQEAATLRLFAEESRLLAAQGGGLVLAGHGPVRPLVVLMPHGVHRPGPGHRVVQILTFLGVVDFRRKAPSLPGRVQGLAVAGDWARLEHALAAAPEYRAPYVCRPGYLQSPPADWLENGLDLCVELARFGGSGGITAASRP